MNLGDLAAYVAERDRERAQRVSDALAALTPRERALVKEAAVMGYVRGVQAVLGADEPTEIPSDPAVLAEVIGACLNLPDLYPTLAGGEA